MKKITKDLSKSLQKIENKNEFNARIKILGDEMNFVKEKHKES